MNMKCPRCKNIIFGYPAISRIDNKTEICSTCGLEEALESFISHTQRKIDKLKEEKGMFKIGNTIKIISMESEPQYTGKIGVVTHIDDSGQLHGTWGGLAVNTDVDEIEIVKDGE